MNYILDIVGVINRCRHAFIEEDIDISFAEALVLSGIISISGKSVSLAKDLYLDRAHVYRVLKRLITKGYIVYEDATYYATPKGEVLYLQSRELCRDVLGTSFESRSLKVSEEI